MKTTTGFILLDAIMTLCLLSLGVGVTLTAYQKLMAHHDRAHFMSLAYLYYDSGLALITSKQYDSSHLKAWQSELRVHLPQGRGVLDLHDQQPYVSISFHDLAENTTITIP